MSDVPICAKAMRSSSRPRFHVHLGYPPERPYRPWCARSDGDQHLTDDPALVTCGHCLKIVEELRAHQDEAYDDRQAARIIAELRKQVAAAEEYAAEGWAWVDEACKALGVETVFEFKAAGERAALLQKTVDFYANINDELILAESQLDALIDELEKYVAAFGDWELRAIVAKYKADERSPT